MNKKILIPLLIVFLIFFILSFAEAQCTNDQGQIRAKPKGKIKSFTEKCYTIYQDKYLLNLKDSYFYNDNGDLLKQLSYSTFDSSTVIQTEAYVYTNRLNEYNYYHKSTKLNIKIKYQYDDKGKKIKETRNIGSVSASTTVFKYNKQGILNEEQFYTPKGKLYSIIYYNYDSLGNQAGEERRSLTSNSMIKYFYKYNDKKNLIEKTEYEETNDRNLFSKRIYKYDEKNRKIEEIITAIDFYSRFTYMYDFNNNNIEEYNYDDNGKLHSKISYRIEYDKYGNWITTTCVNDNTINYIVKREIEYLNNNSLVSIK